MLYPAALSETDQSLKEDFEQVLCSLHEKMPDKLFAVGISQAIHEEELIHSAFQEAFVAFKEHPGAAVPEPLLQLQFFRPVVIGERDDVDPGKTEVRKPVVDDCLGRLITILVSPVLCAEPDTELRFVFLQTHPDRKSVV